MHTAVSLQLVVLAEGALIHQQLDSLASGELASLVLRVNALLASADESLVTSLSKSLREGLGQIDGSSKAALRHHATLLDSYRYGHGTLREHRRNGCQHLV